MRKSIALVKNSGIKLNVFDPEKKIPETGRMNNAEDLK